jgi:hypothetical protein
MTESGEIALRQRVVDEEHLRLLSLFHYIAGGMTLAFSLMFAAMIGFMSAMFSMMPPEQAQHGPPVATVLLFFFAFVAAGVLLGVLDIVAGRCISVRRARVFTLIMAIPGVIFIPYGTLLSVFTLLVLDRDSVKNLYEEGAA